MKVQGSGLHVNEMVSTASGGPDGWSLESVTKRTNENAAKNHVMGKKQTIEKMYHPVL